MKFKRLSSLILIVGLTIFLSACVNKNQEVKEPDVISVIVKNEFMGDHGFTDEVISTLDNIQEDEKFNIALRYLEVVDESDYKVVIDEAVNDGSKLIIVCDKSAKRAVLDAVETYPDVKFALIDDILEGKNIQSVVFEDGEAAFLAGYSAAKKSESGKLGFVALSDSSDKDVQSYEQYRSGFIAGAKYANKDIEIVEQILENDVSSSDCYDAVKTMVDESGIDVVYHVAKVQGNGVIEAADDLEIFAIGSERDQSHLNSKVVLSSTVKNLDMPFRNIISDALKEKFSESTTVYNIKNDGVDLKDRAGNLGESLTGEINKIKTDIKNEKIVVPKSQEELDEFINKL